MHTHTCICSCTVMKEHTKQKEKDRIHVDILFHQVYLKSYRLNVFMRGLEKWLCGREHLPFLQRTWQIITIHYSSYYSLTVLFMYIHCFTLPTTRHPSCFPVLPLFCGFVTTQFNQGSLRTHRAGVVISWSMSNLAMAIPLESISPVYQLLRDCEAIGHQDLSRRQYFMGLLPLPSSLIILFSRSSATFSKPWRMLHR